MHLFSFVSDLSGLTKRVEEALPLLARIAEALERIAPPIPLPIQPKGGSLAEHTFHFAESPGEYEARRRADGDLAFQLGVAPWSPDFERLVSEIKTSLEEPQAEWDEEKQQWVEKPGLDAAQAERTIREAFAIAQAAAASGART
jgi:hypothetical protein